MAKDNGDFLILKILETEPGKEVANIFLTTLFQTGDLVQATEGAKQLTERNNILGLVEISMLLDFLTKIASMLLKL
jgi:hypothetical protein